MTIMARYSGACPECGGGWTEGDLIRKVPGPHFPEPRWQHDTCPYDPGPLDLRQGEAVCETCWLVHPAGACDR